jgi:phosphoribosylformimino-5-aminoimidazole carboxamide ribotide isomerase
MIVYPAIDLKGGQCVRLLQGRMEDATVYGKDPAAMARKWAGMGAKWLHVVDLDGAFAGQSANLEAVREIVAAIDIPVQLGGGIRSLDHIRLLLEKVGVQRVILGTAALEDPELLQQAADQYGSRIAVGIDAVGGKVAVRGWADVSDEEAVELGNRVRRMGVQTVIYTDISRDGMMTGPNFAETRRMIEQTGLDIIVSGGVAALEDVRQSRNLGAAGVILGRSIYQGAIDLSDAIALEEE